MSSSLLSSQSPPHLPHCLDTDGGDAGAEYVSTSVAAEDLGPIPTPAPDAPAVAGDKDGDGGIDGFLYNGCFGFETQNPFNLLLEEDMKPEMTPEARLKYLMIAFFVEVPKKGMLWPFFAKKRYRVVIEVQKRVHST